MTAANCLPDYGFLTVISNVQTKEKPANLTETLRLCSEKTALSDAELLLLWAYNRLGGIVVTSTSKVERAERLISLVSTKKPDTLEAAFDAIEQAAKADGYAGKVFYPHPHMNKAKHVG
jgi:aryl-alcohol dehydrogenase-like predicted oxidoreductase